MQYRTNPRNGDQISALGLGCMRFPGPPGHPDHKQVRALISHAVELGINYLDTAYLYPGNEVAVGAAVEELDLRDQVFIATKLPHGSCKTPEDFDRLFSEQLRRLRTDHVDYYLMHNVTSPAQWERLCALGIETWIAQQKEADRIRQIGFSYHGSRDDFPVLLDAYNWDFCQIQYNYVGENYQAGTAGLKAAAERGLAVFIMEPLLGGRLADKLPRNAARILESATTPSELATSFELVTPGSAMTLKLATPAAWGLSWVWDHPEVTMLLSGMNTLEQLDENVGLAARALPGCFTAEEHAVIERVREEFNRTNRVPCTGCNYCMPCPKGINIPGCFAAYNASFAHGWFTGVSQYFTASAIRTSEPKLVSNCIHCGACARKCPQHIDIPARLVEVGHRFQPGPVGWVLSRIARSKR